MSKSIVTLVLLVTLISGCTGIKATETECQNEFTLAQAVVDRDLGFGTYLYCDKNQE